jgi:hypothetical protein
MKFILSHTDLKNGLNKDPPASVKKELAGLVALFYSKAGPLYVDFRFPKLMMRKTALADRWFTEKISGGYSVSIEFSLHAVSLKLPWYQT